MSNYDLLEFYKYNIQHYYSRVSLLEVINRSEYQMFGTVREIIDIKNSSLDVHIYNNHLLLIQKALCKLFGTPPSNSNFITFLIKKKDSFVNELFVKNHYKLFIQTFMNAVQDKSL